MEGLTCHLPFVYKNKTYNECTRDDSDTLWCHTGARDQDNQLVRGDCQPGCASKLRNISYSLYFTKIFGYPDKYFKNIFSVGCHSYLGTRCIFPFKFNGTTFTGCERDKTSRQDLRWCATEVEEDGEMVEGKWEYCHAGCD